VLDFLPNAVHAGIYAAERRGFYEDAGIDLTIRQPGDSTDAPKLLEAGRTEFAILDVHDLGIARERGLDLVGAMAIVQRPLAAVIARDGVGVQRPRDLEGRTVGVTGLPSDEAVVDSELRADGGDPALAKRVTIGFNAVASLAAGKVDAATAFWNAEGVALQRRGVPVRIFKVDRYGAPPYPELILTASRSTIDRRPELVEAMVEATARGYELATEDPDAALEDLLASAPELDRREQAAQLDALGDDLRPVPFDRQVLREWAAWDLEHGLLRRPLDISAAFRLND
jgi:putative hydroxymethylpyrimidine transport system substrate-binding protein